MLFGMKGRSKKIIALLLSASMMCSMDIATSFAAENNKTPNFELSVESESEENAELTADGTENENVAVNADGTSNTDGVANANADSDADAANANTTADSTKVDGAANTDAEEKADDAADTDETIADEDVLSENAVDEIEEVSANGVSEPGLEEVNTVSGSTIEISTNRADSKSTGFVVDSTKIKTTIDKKYRLKITWKKPKGAKGKTTYHITKMSKDGTFNDNDSVTTQKATYLDTNITADSPMVYRIIPEGPYMDKFNTIEGDAAYVVAAPVIVNAERTLPSASDNNINIKVHFTDLKISENMVLYELERATKNKKTFYSTISSGDLTECEDGVDSKVKFKPLSGKADIASITDLQYEDHEYGKSYFYKVRASVTIDGTTYSSESKAFKTTIFERAPRYVSANVITGTKVLLYWEDMTGNGGSVTKDALLEDEDGYQLYYSLNGGKPKKYRTLLAKDVHVLDTVSDNETIIPYEHSIVSVNIAATGHHTAYYTCKDLKANGNYTFYVAPIREKKEGARGISNAVATDLSDVYSLSVDQTKEKSLTVTWSKVEGAKSYNLYYKKCATAAEAAALSAKWQNMDGVPASDGAKVFKVKPAVSGRTETYLHKKLVEGDYYAYKVIPVRGKATKNGSPFEAGERDNVDKGFINTGYGLVRLATPSVKVTEDGSNITFSWKKVKGAAGYVIYSCKSERLIYCLNDNGNIVDTDPRDNRNELSVTADKLTKNGIKLGEGMYVQVVAYAASSELAKNPNLYDEKDINCSRRSALKEGYYRPKTPEVNARYNATGTGATLMLNSGYKTSDIKNTYMGYKIMYSYTGKNFTTLSSNFNGGKVGYESLAYNDDRILNDGKTIYYRVYSVASPYTGNLNDLYKEGYSVPSKKYVEIKYCQPTKISRDTVTVKLGENLKVKINFKPSTTTMKQMESWYIGDKSDATNLQLNNGSYVKTNNGVMKAIAIKYDDIGTPGLKDEIRIEGLKTGSAYVTATTMNGLKATFKVNVVAAGGNSGTTTKGDVIVLDPGHGGNDGGASNGSLKESEINLKISQYTRDYLEDYGFTVYMTRSSDKYVGLAERVIYAKEKGAKAIISQHINSGGSSGSECYYSIDGAGKSLAEKMSSKTASALGITNRGAKSKKNSDGKDYYAIIRYARSTDKDYGGKAITGVIMENAFIDGDSGKLDSDEKLKKIAKANAEAIKEIYK